MPALISDEAAANVPPSVQFVFFLATILIPGALAFSHFSAQPSHEAPCGLPGVPVKTAIEPVGPTIRLAIWPDWVPKPHQSPSTWLSTMPFALGPGRPP